MLKLEIMEQTSTLIFANTSKKVRTNVYLGLEEVLVAIKNFQTQKLWWDSLKAS